MEAVQQGGASAPVLNFERSDADAVKRAAAATTASPAARYFKHLIIDGFLPEEFRARLLRYTLERREAFRPTTVSQHRYAHSGVDSEARRSWYCPHGLGELTAPFKEAIKSGLLPRTADLGVRDFPISNVEFELVAHRDGSFFRRHIDTATQSARDSFKSDRVVTAVYYFHAAPKQFAGGELALAPLGPGAPKLIEPSDNRLLAFASFVPHEVLPVVCPINDFSHARFAVNIWLHREKRAS